MQFSLGLLTTALKCTVLGLSLLTVILAGAFLAKWNDPGSSWPGIGSIYVSHPGANGLIASMVFNLVYYIYFLIFYFIRPSSVFICMIVDTSFTGFLLLFSLGATGAMTASTSSYGTCATGNRPYCGLGQAATAFGWLTTFLLLGILAFQVSWTLVRCGMDMDTWRTPFNELLDNGAAIRPASRTREKGSPEGSVSGLEAGYGYGGQERQQQQPLREIPAPQGLGRALGKGYAPVPTNHAQPGQQRQQQQQQVAHEYQQYPMPQSQDQHYQQQQWQPRQGQGVSYPEDYRRQ